MGSGSATLVLTLARPDRLLSVKGSSQSEGSSKGLAALSGNSPSTLGKLANCFKLLQWLYNQPWYADSPTADKDLSRIWRFRADLIDAFAYEGT